MYIKTVFKGSRKNGDRVIHFRMVESYRYGDTVKQQTIYHLGALEELPRHEDKKLLGIRIDQIIKEKITGQLGMFTAGTGKVEELAQHFSHEIIVHKKIDISHQRQYELVDTDRVTNHNAKEIGGEWLCAQVLDQLQLKETLNQAKWSDTDIALAYTHLISRAVHPASEYATAKWIKDNSAVCEITNYPVEKITKDKLYYISHKLYKIKDRLEQHLSTKTNELFDIDDNIMIFDLTNTYYEGRMEESLLANYGRSKEKRKDAKLIVLGLVVNEYGFVKYSSIFEGNTADSKSLEKIIDQLSQSTSYVARRPTIVIDAGIATNDNLKLLSDKGYSYMCVSRSGLTKYQVESENPILMTDKKSKTLTLQRVKVEGSTDNYVRVYSEAKQQKEKSMNEQFRTRFLKGIDQITQSLSKKNGTKNIEKVAIRIGRLKEKYPSITKYYEITTEKEGEIVTAIHCKEKTKPLTEGVYLLRTNLSTKDEKTQWKIYNVIREVEATFRVMKTDLDLRPIYHKTDDASKAHLHLGILAYTMVNTIRHQLKKEGIQDGWTEVMRKMNTQKIVTTRLEGPQGKIIHIRKCTEPTSDVERIYKVLGYKIRPFNQKKFVVTPEQQEQSEIAPNQKLSSA